MPISLATAITAAVIATVIKAVLLANISDETKLEVLAGGGPIWFHAVSWLWMICWIVALVSGGVWLWGLV